MSSRRRASLFAAIAVAAGTVTLGAAVASGAVRPHDAPPGAQDYSLLVAAGASTGFFAIGNAGLNTSQAEGFEFTVGATGDLTGVAVQVYLQSGADPLTVRIEQTGSEAPAGTGTSAPLAETTIAASAASNAAQTLYATFPTPVSGVIPGQKYWITLSTASTSTWEWEYDQGGQQQMAATSSDNGKSYGPKDEAPGGYATYVNNPYPTGGGTASPTPSPSGSTVAPAPGATLTVDGPSSIVYGKQAKLTGTLTAGGQPLANAAVTLTEAYTGGKAQGIGTATTNASGQWSFTTKPAYSGVITASAAGQSSPVTVDVAATLDSAKVTVKAKKATLTARLEPGFSGKHKLTLALTAVDGKKKHSVTLKQTLAEKGGKGYAHGYVPLTASITLPAGTWTLTLKVSGMPSTTTTTLKATHVRVM